MLLNSTAPSPSLGLKTQGSCAVSPSSPARPAAHIAVFMLMAYLTFHLQA